MLTNGRSDFELQLNGRIYVDDLEVVAALIVEGKVVAGLLGLGWSGNGKARSRPVAMAAEEAPELDDSFVTLAADTRCLRSKVSFNGISARLAGFRFWSIALKRKNTTSKPRNGRSSRACGELVTSTTSALDTSISGCGRPASLLSSGSLEPWSCLPPSYLLWFDVGDGHFRWLGPLPHGLKLRGWNYPRPVVQPHCRGLRWP